MNAGRGNGSGKNTAVEGGQGLRAELRTARGAQACTCEMA